MIDTCVINVILDYAQPTLTGAARVNEHPKDQPRQIVVTAGMVRWYDTMSDRITRYYRPTRASIKRIMRAAPLAQLNKARIV